MERCVLCPRECGVNRMENGTGYCGQTAETRAARAALHRWEEPCISGANGSGTVFFSGCPLRCVYCQNRDIALGNTGKPVSGERLPEIFLELQEKGAHNINLVTPTHFIPQIAEALAVSRAHGLRIPVVYNTGGYEKPQSLRLLEGLVNVYLPDVKYASPALSAQYSNAPDYFERAREALAEMYRQTGPPAFDGQTGLMRRGVIVRHLVLPGHTADSKKIVEYLYRAYGNNIYISLMNQYTPMPGLSSCPELGRPVTCREYASVVDFALNLGVENGFIQEGGTVSESFIPPFDGEGL